MRELVIDSFAGGGGASSGIAAALGRDPDYAINHDAEALAMHRVNHPGAVHLSQNIWRVDPARVASRRPVGLLWASPDCKHFSKAKGGRPVKREIRDLAWTVVLWARRARPRVIILENVEEFRDWGPLIDDGNGQWKPCPARRGETFSRWVGDLRRLGYRVEWRELRACDYGAPTIRKRLFLIARRDGRPIVWPTPTHGAPSDPDVIAGRKKPWRTAAEIIDWSLPCHSIFLTREEARIVGVNRPLAEATMARIAKGVKRYVIDAAEPFIVTANHQGDHFRGQGLGEPFKAVTSARDAHGLVTPFLAPVTHRCDTRVNDAREPLRTITTSRRGEQALIAPVLTGCGGRAAQSPPKPLTSPMNTATAKADQILVAAHLTKFSENSVGEMPDEPVRTVTAQGCHIAEVRAFLIKYYGSGGQWQDCRDPVHTVPTRDRLGVVIVGGEPYEIVDIGMRMLSARELFRAQGFPDSYIIDRGMMPDGTEIKLTKTASIRMCGNSVCPPIAEALVRANYVPEQWKEPVERVFALEAT